MQNRTADLNHYLENNWEEVGSKLKVKLNIWMVDMDNFYLNNAMYLLNEFLQKTENLKSDAKIYFGSQEGHCWHEITQTEMMKQMVERTGK